MCVYICAHMCIHICKYIYLYKYTYTCRHRNTPSMVIHSSVDEHLWCSYPLVTLYSVPMNIHIQISVWVPAFSYFRHIPRSSSTWLYGNSILIFINNYHPVFPSTILVVLGKTGWLYHFTLPTTMHKSYSSTISTFVNFHFFFMIATLRDIHGYLCNFLEI